jgi:hypothetical protein
MKKVMFSKDKWYINVIIILVFSLSLLSWIKYAKKACDRALNTESTKTESTAEGAGSTLKWSVFKEPYLSMIDSVSGYLILGEVISDQVIGGSDRWLFYKSSSDADPIGDYEGTNLYTEQEMQEMTNSVLDTQKKMQDLGIKFAMVVAPNKENIYSEYMPVTYHHADVSATDILIDHMKENGVNVISPKDDLLKAHHTDQIYYPYDSHWNQPGAYIAVKDVLSFWDLPMPDLSEREISSKPLHLNYHDSGEDDLALIANIRPFLTDELEYEVEGTVPMDWNTFTLEQLSGAVSFFHNDQAVNDAAILLAGDSFRHSMVPALREQFSDVYVVHRSYYRDGIIDEIKPDYVIFEYVERYSGEIGGVSRSAD